MLRTKVKASSITNLTDARYFAAWEVEWIGFDLSVGGINPLEVHAIREWLDGVKFVGEFGMQPVIDIQSAAEELNLDAIQLDHFAPLSMAQTLQDYTLFKEIVIESLEELSSLSSYLSPFAPYVEYFILNFAKNGFLMNAIELNQLVSISNKYSVLLNAVFEKSELLHLLDTVPVKGIAVNGGEEEKVGYKSFDELDEIMEALEILV